MTAEELGLDRVIGWAQRHVLAVDTAWALLWGLIALAAMPSDWITDAQEPFWVGAVAVTTVALIGRRTRPRITVAVLAVVCVAHVLVLDTYTAVAAVAVFGAAHTAQAQLERRERTAVTLGILAGTAWAALDYSRDVVDLSAEQRWPVIIVQWVLVGFFALLGALARKRRDELERAVEHARLLERQRDQEIRLAAFDERTRIAREMHDIVAHSLGVIIAQADGGRYAAASDPAAGTRALETISEVGRDSLTEMRRLLTVLRSDDARDLTPAPALVDIDALAGDFRKAGLDVRVTVTGEQREVADTFALTVYRIVQESLSNALKHGAQTGSRPVKVELAWEPEKIVIAVRNRLPDSWVPQDDPPVSPGHGLPGMRERVSAHGGAMRAGPVDGLWQVRAELPLPPVDKAVATQEEAP